jgi:hypothetical protein
MTTDNTHRTAIDRLLAEQPPRRLRCFDSDAIWIDYLRTVHDSGEPLTRRQDTGKHRGERKVIQVLVDGASRKACDDCEAGYQAAMKAVGRCELVSPGNAARKWLKGLLAGGPMLASVVIAAAKAQGFRPRSVYRAAQRLRVTRRRSDHTRPETTAWALPDAM